MGHTPHLGRDVVGRWAVVARCWLGSAAVQYVAKGHVWTAPGWQEESSLCSVGRGSHVFGLFCAVPMTAGHNALRESGPGQKHAFDDAVAHNGLS